MQHGYYIICHGHFEFMKSEFASPPASWYSMQPRHLWMMLILSRLWLLHFPSSCVSHRSESLESLGGWICNIPSRRYHWSCRWRKDSCEQRRCLPLRCCHQEWRSLSPSEGGRTPDTPTLRLQMSKSRRKWKCQWRHLSELCHWQPLKKMSLTVLKRHWLSQFNGK